MFYSVIGTYTNNTKNTIERNICKGKYIFLNAICP